MNANYEKLKSLLKELFQINRADLDFGIYRIMHAKHDEIVRFLDNDLLPQVQEAFKASEAGSRAVLEAELQDAVDQAKKLGADPDALPKVRELRAKYGEAVDVSALENEVYSDLYNFFRRYYSDGDFLSLRKYKEGVYAIPYEGEEVKLHWANHDQYYIKTSEYLRDYAFRLPDGRRVHFKLADADTEKDNTKAESGKERRFILAEQDFIKEEDGELVIRFAYQPDPSKQDALNAAAVQKILEAKLPKWVPVLATPAPTEKNPRRTLLEKHLVEYTARNTFDYFIHKNLGGFLRRELDFYIKNEILHIDDIESETAPKVEQKMLNKIRAIRTIARKLIEFLAQLEDFQKKMWLKKKFVVETNYCITLDRVPEALYAEIVKNDAQREEWVRLFAIDEIEGDLATLKYTKPFKVGFLKANPFLVLDTKFFGQSFIERLLASIEDCSRACDGVLIHSDNFQALRLLQSRASSFNCVYIDPPYNTDASPIMYKNGYKSSTWTTLMENGLRLCYPLLAKSGVLVAAIDDEQQLELHFLLTEVFNGRILGTIVVRANPSGRPTQTGYSVAHEYLLYAGKDSDSAIGRMLPTDEQMSRFSERDERGQFEWRNLRREGSNSDRNARQALYYPIYLAGSSLRVPRMDWNDATEEWIVREEPREGETIVFPDNEDGQQKTWRWEWETVMDSLADLAVRKDRSGKDYVYYKRRPHEDGVVSVSCWFDAKYSATEHGTALLKAMFGRSVFSYPKSLHAVVDSIYVAGGSEKDAHILDYFAGSATTAHAVIVMNVADAGRRKYTLVEMGDYFDSVLKPRIQKVIYSADWADGKPVSRQGSSHMFKYIRLESYEDTLNNLELRRTPRQDELLKESKDFRETYTLSYMLDVEGKDSLLNIKRFDDPFAYQLKIGTGSVGETKPVTVDLVETFNYLIGLTVKHTDMIRGVKVVEGKDPKGNRVLVLWRKTKEMDNDKLDGWFKKQGYNTKDMEYDLVYVNGDNNLENLRRADHTWKVRLIEEEFHRLMFECKDV